MPAPSAPIDPLTGLSAARFGVYVHFPYCLSKCPYCDFASTVARQVPQERYAQAIATELKARLARTPLADRTLDSIYFGGGTPSLWEVRHVASVLEMLAGALRISPGAEITLEANPGASDSARFSGYRAAGVNRLSIGVQSFQPSTLAALGRAHDGPTAVAAFRAARQAGFDNVSLDFIYGVHGQSLEQVVADAEQASSLQPDHLSAYALTLDRESLAEEVPLAKQLSRGEVMLPPDDTVVAMGAAVRDVYGAKGLARYEISNFARPGFHSRHNALYWTGGEYLALGVGATGFLRTGPREGLRWANLRSADQYLKAVESSAPAEASTEPLTADELFEERVAMGLRLTSGVDLAAACEAFGKDPAPRLATANRLVQDGFARWDGSRLSLTDRGADVHSAISARLM